MMPDHVIRHGSNGRYTALIHNRTDPSRIVISLGAAGTGRRGCGRLPSSHQRLLILLMSGDSVSPWPGQPPQGPLAAAL